MSKVCLNNICQQVSCADKTQNGDETDVDCGGSSCQGCADTKKCLKDTDCLSKVCVGNICQKPTCTDKAQNGDETDIDCGGLICVGCADTKKCKLPADCLSKVCNNNICQKPTCTDKAQNGYETDVDCGGGTCVACADTKKCKANSDCVSKVCTGNICQKPTCTDKVKNGAETDIDCGGTCPNCAANKACKKNSDCASGLCLSNLCAAVPTGSNTLTLAMTPATGSAGGMALTVKSTTGFKAGQRVLIHQTQGSGAGAYEEAEVLAVNATGLTLTLKAALKNTYITGTGNNRAQVIAMATYGSLVVKSGVSMRAPAWNGTVGGILPLYVAGTLQLDKGGTLTMVGNGFRGTTHKGMYRNKNGWQGESEMGAGKQLTTPNGAGGSGGYQVKGKNGSGGGGGGHAAAGANSVANQYSIKGVSGGKAVGAAAMSKIYVGAAGGEGSADEDGNAPGAGGHGAGVIYIRATTAVINGKILVDGGSGGNGDQKCGSCGGAGMAGGGGGAGGSIYLYTPTLTMAINTLSARGGNAGKGTESNPGGVGSVGRIRVDHTTLNGSANGSAAAVKALKDASYPDAYGGKI